MVPRSESVPIASAIPAPRRAKERAGGDAAGSVSRGSGASGTAGSPASGSLANVLSKSISTAESDYFAADAKELSTAAAAGIALSSSPMAIEPGASAAAAASSSGPRRSVSASSPPSHVAGSYITAEEGDEEATLHDGSDIDEAHSGGEGGEHDEEHSRSRSRSASNSVTDQSTSSGVLSAPAAPLSARREDGPVGSHRFRVWISHWMWAGKDDAATDIAASPAASAASSSASPAPGGKSKKSSGKHVVYVIVVREFFELSNFLEWSVRRRFAEFAHMHSALEAHVGSGSAELLPRLPKKTLFSTKKQSAAFLNARMQQLETYVQQLVNNNAFQIDQLHAFFDMKNATRKITMGNLKNRT
jgi:hypothetical protein